MEVRFDNDTLQGIWLGTDPGRTYSKAIVKAFRKRVQFLLAATDLRSLRAMNSLNFEELAGPRQGEFSIRLNDQFRLIFRIEEVATGPVLAIQAIEDYH